MNKIDTKDKRNTVKKNYLYNAFYQIFALIIILVSTPYVTRVLGAEGIGIYNYTYSYVTYFILIGSLGISLYGQREIAYYQDDIIKRSKNFFELFIFRLILLGLAVLFFYLFFCLSGPYKTYYTILILELIGSGLDIMWLYQGMEDFKKSVVRNVILRTLCTISIFIFVKKPTDLWIYFFVLSFSTLISNLSLWFGLSKYICKVDIKTLNIKKHLKPILILFIPQVAVQIYTVLDKTMIGLITNNMSYVGIYQKTQEIVKLGLMIVTSFGGVMFPRLANNYMNKNDKKIGECIETSFGFVWIVTFLLVFGLMACSNNFIPWYLGSQFESAKGLLMVFSFIMIAIGLNNVVGMQYLVATNQQKVYTYSVISGAILNFVGNLLLIGKYNIYGAVISSIFSETIILAIEFIYMREVIKGHINHKLAFKCLMSGVIMFVIVYNLGKHMSATYITTGLQAFVGFIVYIGLLVLFKEPIVIANIKMLWNKIRKCRELKK